MAPRAKSVVDSVEKETLVECYECNDDVREGDEIEHDGRTYCEGCFNDNFFICEECEECVNVDDAISENDTIYCEDCHDENFTKCHDCGGYEHNDDAFSLNSGDLCQECYENNYFSCDNCDEVIHNDYYGSDGRCQDCEQEEESDFGGGISGVHDASFMPTLQFNKMAWENTTFQGVELEIEVRENISLDRHATEFLAFLKREGLDKAFYLKEDGSLNHGYEIVTHPFTSQSRHAKLNWHKVLKYLKASGAKTFRTSSCGLHIHISRESLTPKDILKLKLFFSNCKSRVERIAGREANDYCAFEPMTLGLYKSRLKSRSIGNGTRYVAINVNEGSRKRTIEFRIFKATLEIERLLGCFQFVDAICDWVKLVSVAKIDRGAWLAFKEWVSRESKYQTLVKHMRKVGV